MLGVQTSSLRPARSPVLLEGLPVSLSTALPFIAFVAQKLSLSETENLLFRNPLTKAHYRHQTLGEQQSAGLDQEAEVNRASMAPGSPGEGLKWEVSRWGNPPLQDIRTVVNSRCSPPHTKAFCHGWLMLLG